VAGKMRKKKRKETIRSRRNGPEWETVKVKQCPPGAQKQTGGELRENSRPKKEGKKR